MTKWLLILLALFPISTTTVNADECTLKKNLTKAQVQQLIGAPDWIQADNSDCWAYFNSGTETMFRNDRLYAVRYRRGSPSLPSFLEQAGVSLGGIKRKFPKLVGPVDSSMSRWETEIYSDKRTYLVAINYNKYSKYLDNVLVQQAQYEVYCDGLTPSVDNKLYKRWFEIGTLVKNYLEAKTLKNDEALLNLKKFLMKFFPNNKIQPLITLLNTSSPNGDYSALAMQFRDLLIEAAARQGRDIHSNAPVAAFFDGMYTALLMTNLKLKGEFSFAEAQNHFSGLSQALRSQHNHEIEQLLNALKSKNSTKIKEASQSLMSRVLLEK